MSADLNQMQDLADMLHMLLADADPTDPVDRLCLQYVVLHFVVCDLLPTAVFAAELAPFLSLYDRLAGEEAHSPTAVTSTIISVLAAWLVLPQPSDAPA